jgi:phosphoenolpyruvate carboxylase
MAGHLDSVSVDGIYLKLNEFYDEHVSIRSCLDATNNEYAAEGMVTDILVKVSAFGVTLIPLDIRQESGRHEEALDCITKFLGLGSYAQWDEEAKVTWLSSQIYHPRDHWGLE